MIVIPAIDLRGGRCVRLFRGDYSAETVYDDDPVEVAVRFHRRSHLPIVAASGLTSSTVAIPWWAGRKLHLVAG